MSEQKITQKLADQRVRQSREFCAEQARRRGESEAASKRQGDYAAEAAFRQLKERIK